MELQDALLSAYTNLRSHRRIVNDKERNTIVINHGGGVYYARQYRVSLKDRPARWDIKCVAALLLWRTSE